MFWSQKIKVAKSPEGLPEVPSGRDSPGIDSVSVPEAAGIPGDVLGPGGPLPVALADPEPATPQLT